MKIRKSLVVIPIISALVLAIAIGVMAFSPSSASSAVLDIQAQEEETDDPLPWNRGFGSMRGFGHRGRLGFSSSFDHDAYMADALGVTVDELKAARQAARDATLDQAVAEGVITQEQADLMNANQALRQYINQQEIISEVLGIDAADLEAARQEGKSLYYLFGELGLEPAEVQAAMQAAYDDAINQAVADGVITDSQAEQLQERGFGGRGFGKRGFGGFHGHGGTFGPRLNTIPDSDI
jgi:hypothetical protein